MKAFFYCALIALYICCGGCGRAPVTYEDPGSITPLTTDFSLADLNIIANKMVGSLLTSDLIEAVTQDQQRPILVVQRIQNRTDQHIDTESITDTIRTELVQSSKFRFTDASSRNQVQDELLYQRDGGMVDQAAATAIGQHAGAQYALVGAIVSYQERTQNVLRKSYKFTLNLINLKNGLIDWAQEVPISKQHSRPPLGR